MRRAFCATLALAAAMTVACGEPLLLLPNQDQGQSALCAEYALLASEAAAEDARVYQLMHDSCVSCETLADAATGEINENAREQLQREYRECLECREDLDDALASDDADRRQYRIGEYLECMAKIQFPTP